MNKAQQIGGTVRVIDRHEPKDKDLYKCDEETLEKMKGIVQVEYRGFRHRVIITRCYRDNLT